MASATSAPRARARAAVRRRCASAHESSAAGPLPRSAGEIGGRSRAGRDPCDPRMTGRRPSPRLGDGISSAPRCARRASSPAFRSRPRSLPAPRRSRFARACGAPGQTAPASTRAPRPAPEKSAPAAFARLLAELIAQHARRHLLDLALLRFRRAGTARTTRGSGVRRQPEMSQHLAHLAVLALADGEREPDVGGLLAVERRLDRPVADAVDRDAVAQRVELRPACTLPCARTR